MSIPISRSPLLYLFLPWGEGIWGDIVGCLILGQISHLFLPPEPFKDPLRSKPANMSIPRNREKSKLWLLVKSTTDSRFTSICSRSYGEDAFFFLLSLSLSKFTIALKSESIEETLSGQLLIWGAQNRLSKDCHSKNFTTYDVLQFWEKHVFLAFSAYSLAKRTQLNTKIYHLSSFP